MSRNYTKIFIGILIVAALFMVLSSSYYTVDQAEYGVLVTFGKPNPSIVAPGLRFKLPYPIQEVKKVSRETFSLTFGYEESGNNVTTKEKDARPPVVLVDVVK